MTFGRSVWRNLHVVMTTQRGGALSLNKRGAKYTSWYSVCVNRALPATFFNLFDSKLDSFGGELALVRVPSRHSWGLWSEVI